MIDKNSGVALGLVVGEAYDRAEDPGRQAAKDLGDEIIVIQGEELDRWKAATQPTIDAWIEERTEAGDDGQALLDAARRLIEKHSNEG